MNSSKGFTIIELLVVIAIIGVLAAIVLVNVTAYINKGKDAAIMGNLSTVLTNSAVFFDATGAFTNFNGNAGYTVPAAAINTAGGVTAISISATAFCACSPMKVNSSNAYCIDSTGAKKIYAGNCTAGCASQACQ